MGGVTANADIKVKGYDATVNAKVFLPIDQQFMPYGVVGLGYARFKGDASVSVEGAGVHVSESDSTTDNGPLARIGAGCDYFISDNLGIEAEATYNHCFSDLKGLNFIDLNVGVIFPF